MSGPNGPYPRGLTAPLSYGPEAHNGYQRSSIIGPRGPPYGNICEANITFYGAYGPM